MYIERAMAMTHVWQSFDDAYFRYDMLRKDVMGILHLGYLLQTWARQLSVGQ